MAGLIIPNRSLPSPCRPRRSSHDRSLSMIRIPGFSIQAQLDGTLYKEVQIARRCRDPHTKILCMVSNRIPSSRLPLVFPSHFLVSNTESFVRNLKL